MKPNFALKLSNDGAELLHRVEAGWSPVGTVSFETDDVAAECARLLQAAALLDPSGVRTKVVIPPDEVRYAMVVAPGPTDEARRYQIEAEIERLTPYSIDELVYDWAVEDDHALVVICARETLIEAETFAEDYGFNPVSFVAIPEAGQFVGEPWFGETRVAKAHMPAGEPVQRDADAIRIVSARPAKPAPAPIAAAPVVSTPTPSTPAAATPSPAPTATIAPPASIARPAAFVSARPAMAPPLASPVSVAPTTSTPFRPADAQKLPTPAVTPPARPSTAPRALVGDMVRRMGTRLRREQAAAAAGEAASEATSTPAPVADATPVAETVAFASRRKPAPVQSLASAPPSGPGPGGRIAVMRSNVPRKGAQAAKAMVRRLQAVASGVLTRASALRLPRRAAIPTPAPIVPTSRPPLSERERNREQEAMTIFGARGNTVAAPSMARRGLAIAGGLLMILIAIAVWTLYFDGDSRSQLADAGGGDIAALPQIEPPRQVTSESPQALGAAPLAEPLIVTPPAPVAAPPLTAEPATPPAESAAEGQVATIPADPDAMLESLVEQALDEALPAATVDSAEQVAAQASQPVEQGAAPTAAQPATPGLAAEGSSTVASRAPEAPPVTTSEVADVRLTLPRSIALPSASEVAFEVPPPPPPFGTTFTFDERGLVEATREGAATPSGVTVFARRPAVVPAPAPGRQAAPAPAVQAIPSGEPVAAAIESAIAEAVGANAPGSALATAPPVETAAPADPVAPPVTDPATPASPGTEVIYDDTPRADPALSRFRPQPRSERVRVIGEQAAQDDQTSLTPTREAAPSAQPATSTALAAPEALETPLAGGVALTALRPQRRPTDIAPLEAETAVAEPVTALDLAGATPEAVAQSPVPSARPSDIEERARRILAAARPATPTAAPQDIENESGETATSTAAPAIPSTASVARQATETDAIRLGDINLIGVFGAPGDRRALVRLSSGRMVRVQVGDRLDGGQVSAIGESELRYTRSGRNQVLRIGG